MFTCKLTSVVDTGFYVPALIVVSGLAVAQGWLATTDYREISAIEGRIGYIHAGTVSPGCVFDGLVVTS